MSYQHHDPKGSDETNNVGALANGLANSAINDTEIDDNSTGYVGGVANGDDRNNTDVDVDAKVDVAIGNGDNRDNSYDWDYDSKSYSDNDTKTVTDTDIKTTTDYDWDYDSKSYSDNDTKTVTDTDTKTTTTTDSFNTADSFNSDDSDFGTVTDNHHFDNLGVAGGDLEFDIGDDFSFSMDVDDILNDSLNGAGNDSGFSAVQANYLADQDSAWNLRMENAGANNNLSANAGQAMGNEGIDMDGKGWDVKAGDDVEGSSVADASAILANSGFHMELVQGANLLGNTIDSSVVGGNSHINDVGGDLGEGL